MATLFRKLISPLTIAWGRTPVVWKWKTPKDDIDAVRIHIASHYHPGWHAPRYRNVSNILYFFMVIVWPIRAILLIAKRTYIYGAKTKILTGKGFIRQILEQLKITFLLKNNPEVYYLFDLFTPDLLAQSRQFMLDNEMFALVGLLNNYESDEFVEDKLTFSQYMRDHGVSVADDIALLTGGRAETPDGEPFKLPRRDFIIKPRMGLQGDGFACFEYLGDQGYQTPDDQVIDADRLLEQLLERGRSRPLVVQHRLTNHALVKPLALRGLATARMLTCREPSGDVTIVQAVFKMPIGSTYADNYHLGSIASPIDLDDGTLGPAKPEALLVLPIHQHPTTNGQISGQRLPDWPAAKSLLQKAHGLLPQYVQIAWDVAFTDSGPVAIEANRDMGMALLQRPGTLPLGQSRLPAICREILKQR